MNNSNFKLVNYMAKRIKKLNETTSYYKTLDSLSYILGFKDYNDLLNSNLTTSKLREKFEDIEYLCHSGLVILSRSEN